eukprot:GEZU01025084.1.p1 GENE.GEZU01025084.1~~GEZU01025084.1.p1  ORF type:complete len:211 (-),score=70.90 GEZU01025084.1:319-951(-)
MIKTQAYREAESAIRKADLYTIDELLRIWIPHFAEDDEYFELQNKCQDIYDELFLHLDDGDRGDKGTMAPDVNAAVAEIFKLWIQKYLFHYPRLPLHELFFVKMKPHPQQNLLSKTECDSRTAIQQALSNIKQYLPVSSATSKHATTDASVLYKLYLENARTINVHDWIVAFCEEIDTRAKADLEFIGLIRDTKKKKDHVEKLVFEQLTI